MALTEGTMGNGEYENDGNNYEYEMDNDYYDVIEEDSSEVQILSIIFDICYFFSIYPFVLLQ